MKETKFIEQNKEKWINFENMLRLNMKDPDRLSDLFVQITDDLSYSRTFYPNRFITVYLNNLCQQLFYNIYTNRGAKWQHFVAFWRDELPSVVYHARKELFFSLLVFILGLSVGVLSGYKDPEFLRTILGDQYVDMTLSNIKKGDPMAVYKEMHQVDMFLGITFNNLYVSFLAFVLGIIFSIGSAAIILHTGIMVGTFQYFFIERGLFWESFLTVWLHGTLEISAVVLSGGAGILLGKGLIFPGTLPRLKAFQISARSGVKLFLGISPVIILAALIESFITRYTEVAPVLKGGVILISALFVLIYFVWYPYYKAQTGTLYTGQDDRLLPRIPVKLEFEGKIKTINEVFADTVYIFRPLLLKYRPYLIGIGLLYTTLAYFVIHPDLDRYSFGNFIHRIYFHLNYRANPAMFVLNSLSFFLIIRFTMFELSRTIHPNWIRSVRGTLQIALTVLMMSALLFLQDLPILENTWYLPIVLVTVYPLLIFCLAIAHQEGIWIFQAFPRAIRILWGLFSSFIGLDLLLFFLTYALFIFFGFPDVYFPQYYLEFITWNLPENFLTGHEILSIFSSFTFILVLLLMIPLYTIAFTLQYYSFREINEATGLKKQVQEFGLN